MEGIKSLYLLKKTLAEYSNYDNYLDGMKMSRYLLKKKSNIYDLTELIVGKNEVDQIITIMKWLYKNTTHNGCSQETLNLSEINKKVSINCFTISTLLNEAYSSQGFISKSIQTRPKDPFADGNHWINLVYSNSLCKWLMMDATFNAYCKDTNDNILSIEEIRKSLVDNNKINIVCDGVLSVNEYYYLLCETYFHFESFTINTTNLLDIENQTLFNLLPRGFNADEYHKTQLHKISEMCLPEKAISDLAKLTKIRKYTTSPSMFWKVPDRSEIEYV